MQSPHREAHISYKTYDEFIGLGLFKSIFRISVHSDEEVVFRLSPFLCCFRRSK